MTPKKTTRAPAPKTRPARPQTSPDLLKEIRLMVHEAMVGVPQSAGGYVRYDDTKKEPQLAAPIPSTALEAAVHENHLALSELRDMVGSLVGRLERTVLIPSVKQDGTNMAAAGFPAQGGSPVVHSLAGLQSGILEVRYQVQCLIERLEA